MKTIIVLVILCCNSQSESGYKYEAKNLTTNQTGDFYTQVKYNEGDTVRIEINKDGKKISNNKNYYGYQTY